ncbi:hypothetical protein Tco_0545528 [Tanacetum coccineum]
MNDDTPMCESHEVNYIQSGVYQNQNSHDSYSHHSHYEQPKSNNESEKSLTELNNDVKQDLKHFKSCIRSMRTIHDKLFDRDDQSKTDLEKLITKFLDGQRVTNIKIDEWSMSQNVSSEQIDRTGPPPPQAHTEQVNVVFTTVKCITTSWQLVQKIAHQRLQQEDMLSQPATDNSPEVPERTVFETFSNITLENKAHYDAEKEAIHLLWTIIEDEIYSTVDACKTTHDIWIAIERLQHGESHNKQDVKTSLFLGVWQIYFKRWRVN